MANMAKYALFSVTNKDGIIELAKKISESHKILASGGTGRVLKDAGIDVIGVSEFTGSEEMFGGRVKTLHPRIHGGILFQNNVEDRAEAETYGIEEIDIVICNLYEFDKTVNTTNETAEIIESIDIGGPTLIRAAAKNYDRVTVIVDPSDYAHIIQNLEQLEKADRLKLAVKAFDLVRRYDNSISNYFTTQVANDDKLPERLNLNLIKYEELKYGENPHQPAAIYSEGMYDFYHNLTENSVSFNNLLDLAAGWYLVKEFDDPACVIIKHRSPCGVAVGNSTRDAYINALKTDKMSAYGGVYVFNKKIDKDTADELVKMFVDLLLAPSYDDDAIEILQTKEKMKILEINNDRTSELDIQQVPDGFVVQERDMNILTDDQYTIVSEKSVSEQELESLKFAWKVVKHSRSNAIAIVKGTRALGIGSGQTSRVDATTSAIERSGDEVDGGFLASDAFFPFPDSIKKAAKHGIKAIISPQGSIRDQEVIDAANELGIALVFTKVRSFKH